MTSPYSIMNFQCKKVSSSFEFSFQVPPTSHQVNESDFISSMGSFLFIICKQITTFTSLPQQQNYLISKVCKRSKMSLFLNQQKRALLLEIFTVFKMPNGKNLQQINSKGIEWKIQLYVFIKLLKLDVWISLYKKHALTHDINHNPNHNVF